MEVNTVMVDGKLCKYGVIRLKKNETARIAELEAQGFWKGVETGDSYSMLICLGVVG